jgi:hypothetical protein
MAGNPYLWSTTAASNDTIDGAVNWAEGQLPGTVNGSARGMMAGLASWLKDTNGTITTGGSSNAYTVTSNIAYAALATGIQIGVKANHTNTGAATLTLNALSSKAIRIYTAAGDSAVPAGTIISGGHYILRYDAAANSAAGAWILLNAVGGGGLPIVEHSGSSTLTLTVGAINLIDTTGFPTVTCTFPLSTTVGTGARIAVKKNKAVSHHGEVRFAETGSDLVEGVVDPDVGWEYHNYGEWVAESGVGWHFKGHIHHARDDFLKGTHSPTAPLSSKNPSIVRGMADNGSGEIRLEVDDTSGWTTGDVLYLSQVEWDDSIEWTINTNFTATVIDGTHVDLDGSFYPTSGTYEGGGVLGAWNPEPTTFSSQVNQLHSGGTASVAGTLPLNDLITDDYRSPVAIYQKTLTNDDKIASVVSTRDYLDKRDFGSPVIFYEPGDIAAFRADGLQWTTLWRHYSRPAWVNGRKISSSSTKVLMGQLASTTQTLYWVPHTSNACALPSRCVDTSTPVFDIHQPHSAISKNGSSAGTYGAALGDGVYHDVFAHVPAGLREPVILFGPSYSGPTLPTGTGTSECVYSHGGALLNKYAITGTVEVPALSARKIGTVRAVASFIVSIYDENFQAFGTDPTGFQLIASNRGDGHPGLAGGGDLTTGFDFSVAGAVTILCGASGGVVTIDGNGIVPLNGKPILAYDVALKDTGANHSLYLHVAENLSANRTLNLYAADGDRQLGLLGAAISGDTNDSSSGSGAFVNHSLTRSIPAGVIGAGTVVEVTAWGRFTTGTVPTGFSNRLRANSTTTIVQVGPSTPAINLASQTWSIKYMLVGLAAASASSSVECAQASQGNGYGSATTINSISQPVSLATNAAITFDFGTMWASAGTGPNTFTLMGLDVWVRG